MEIADRAAVALTPRQAEVLDRLAALLDFAAPLPGGLALAVDAADEAAANAQAAGFDLDALLREGGALAGALAQAAADAHAEQRAATPPRLGLVGLVRALRDPDVQRALGFALAFSRHLGRRLPRGE